MNLKLYAGINVILAEPQSSLRKQYLAIIKGLGCSDVIETGNMRDVCNALEEGGVDLLIGEAVLPEGKLTEVIHGMRHGQFGDNPFLIAMVLVSESDNELIEQVMDCGSDDILLKPLDAGQLQ